MFLKPGIDITGLKPELLLGLIVSREVFAEHSLDMTVTSVKDGQHSAGSLHYSGFAADIRTKRAGISPETAAALAREMRERLGGQFDVVVESDHIHLEFDPR